jgi:hypothetical protein
MIPSLMSSLMLPYPFELRDKVEFDENGEVRLKDGATEEEKEILRKYLEIYKGTKKQEIKEGEFEDIIDY